MVSGPDPRLALAERAVLGMAVCRALVDTGSVHAPEVVAAHRLFRDWMRERGLWEDTDVPGADIVADELSELAEKAFHAEIVVGRLELVMGSDFSQAADDRRQLNEAVEAWRRKTGYEPARTDYPPTPRLR